MTSYERAAEIRTAIRQFLKDETCVLAQNSSIQVVNKPRVTLLCVGHLRTPLDSPSQRSQWGWNTLPSLHTCTPEMIDALALTDRQKRALHVTSRVMLDALEWPDLNNFDVPASEFILYILGKYSPPVKACRSTPDSKP